MSHFTVWALLAPGADVESTLGKLLAPYDENVDVPEYEQKCWCVGRAAKTAASDHGEAEFPLASLRAKFAAENPLPPGARSEFDVGGDEEEARRLAWEKILAPRLECESKAVAARIDRDAADPKCEECRGTGNVKSTYNPKSKWDWWVIGGRWAGALGPDDKTLASAILARWKPDDAPFAMITPDGEWHQRARMGWFGATSQEEPLADWRAKVRAALADFPNYTVVALDCHI